MTTENHRRMDSSKDLPKVLYKYRSLAGDGFRYTQEIFAMSRVYFARIDEFNDPTEGCACILDEASELMAMLLLRSSALEEHGVFSLSEIPDDILMWSHYADSHRGLCIGFSTTCAESLFTRAKKVNYSRTIGVIPEGFADAGSMKEREVLIGEKKELLCLSKAKQWSYEQEWRILDTPGMHDIAPADIVEIITGPCMPDYYEKWVEHWATTYAPTAKVLTAKFKPTTFEIELAAACSV